jgi:hypothetical protein
MHSFKQIKDFNFDEHINIVDMINSDTLRIIDGNVFSINGRKTCLAMIRSICIESGLVGLTLKQLFKHDVAKMAEEILNSIEHYKPKQLYLDGYSRSVVRVTQGYIQLDDLNFIVNLSKLFIHKMNSSEIGEHEFIQALSFVKGYYCIEPVIEYSSTDIFLRIPAYAISLHDGEEDSLFYRRLSHYSGSITYEAYNGGLLQHFVSSYTNSTLIKLVDIKKLNDYAYTQSFHTIRDFKNVLGWVKYYSHTFSNLQSYVFIGDDYHQLEWKTGYRCKAYNYLFKKPNFRLACFSPRNLLCRESIMYDDMLVSVYLGWILHNHCSKSFDGRVEVNAQRKFKKKEIKDITKESFYNQNLISTKEIDGYHCTTNVHFLSAEDIYESEGVFYTGCFAGFGDYAMMVIEVRITFFYNGPLQMGKTYSNRRLYHTSSTNFYYFVNRDVLTYACFGDLPLDFQIMVRKLAYICGSVSMRCILNTLGELSNCLDLVPVPRKYDIDNYFRVSDEKEYGGYNNKIEHFDYLTLSRAEFVPYGTYRVVFHKEVKLFKKNLLNCSILVMFCLDDDPRKLAGQPSAYVYFNLLIASSFFKLLKSDKLKRLCQTLDDYPFLYELMGRSKKYGSIRRFLHG